MASFSLCTFKGMPAVQFHHEYGDFEFVIMRDPSDANKIVFNSNIALTQSINDNIGKKAIQFIKIFQKRLDINPEDDPTFDDITNVIRMAQEMSAKVG